MQKTCNSLLSSFPARSRHVTLKVSAWNATSIPHPLRCSCELVVTTEMRPPFSFEPIQHHVHLAKISSDLKPSKPSGIDPMLWPGPNKNDLDVASHLRLDLGQLLEKCPLKAKVPLTSPVGRRLFNEALASGSAESYFFLAEQFCAQDEPMYSGKAALAMVLNSLQIDPMRTWKGAWRWFTKQNIGCSKESDPHTHGLTFDMFKHMASSNGANVGVHRAPSTLRGEQEKKSVC